MDSLFCLPQWSILLLSLTIAHHITRLPIWVELHLRIKKRSFFVFMKTPLFPSYLTELDWDGKEGLIEGKCLFLGVKVSYLTSICACVCVGARERQCVWVLRARCHQKHSVSLGTTAKQDFQAHLISSALRCDIVIFFLRKFSQKNSIKKYFYVFSQNSF